MEQKICFVRCPRIPNEYKESFIRCDSTYIPLAGEIVGFFPYPFRECFITGNNRSTCKELFIKKFNNDFETVKKRFEENKKVFDRFIRIKENYEF